MQEGFSPEENRRESKRLHAILESGIREQLMKYPGVKHVTVALKIKEHKVLWERCFRVSVVKKISGGMLSYEEMIPLEITGIKTDIIEITRADPMACIGNHDKVRPVRGGISISNGVESIVSVTNNQWGYTSGTLGGIGRDRNRSCNIMALTNWHVVYMANLITVIKKGSRMFQPNAVANTNNKIDIIPDPQTTENDFGKVVAGVWNDKVDCAVIEINTPCCFCCGEKPVSRIPGLEKVSRISNDPAKPFVPQQGFDGICGTDTRVVTGDRVCFVGATSGPSRGVVITDDAGFLMERANNEISDPDLQKDPGLTTSKNALGQIEFRLADDETGFEPSCNRAITMTGFPVYKRAADHGDSGSLLLNDENKVIGLVFASEAESKLTGGKTELYAYANHYDNVKSALLDKNIYFELFYSQPGVGTNSASPFQVFNEPDSELFMKWKMRIENHPTTNAIFNAFYRHREEVLLLINHCRPVTLAWHRSKGPAFTAIIANHMREGKFEYPAQINGISSRQLLSRMHDVLIEHGSFGLKEDLCQFSKLLQNAVDGGTCFEELFTALTGYPEPSVQ